MAIKRVLLPVRVTAALSCGRHGFHIGEKFSAQVLGLFVQALGLVIPSST
jgi:hypothetical protein